MGINWSTLNGFITTFKRPLAIAIESTNMCNADCIMCGRDNLSRIETIMSFKLFKKIIMEAKTKRIKLFQLSFYGEPLLDEDLIDKINYIKTNIEDSWTKIVTNASLMTKEKSVALLNAGISEIRISVEGNNRKEYENIRRGLKFDEVLSNIENLKKLRDSNSSYKTDIIITGLNLINYPLNEVQFKDYWAKYADAVYIRNENQIDIKIGESFYHKVLPCDELFKTLPILADGSYTICIYDWYGKEVYGNINNSTISQAWFSKKLLFYKLMHLIGFKRNMSLCNNCGYRTNYKKILN